MARRSKIAFLVPIVLLLVRSFLPVVHGQILPLEWNQKSDPIKLYRQQAALTASDRALLSNPTNKYWSISSDPSLTNPNRELVELPVSLLKNAGLHSQQLPPSVYLFAREQQQHPFQRSIPTNVGGVDVLEALNNKLFYQQPNKRQDQQQKETEVLLKGNGPSVDYSSDEPSAQLVQPASPNGDDYSQPPQSKAKIKQKQTASADGLARYLIFSNLKRARDGYICHFKLCQVGVSGKRLSDM